MGTPGTASGKQSGQQVASIEPAHQAPDPAHATGVGYAQVIALARNGVTDPTQFSEAIAQHPEDKARIVEFLQQQLGNGFTQKVLQATVSHSPAGGANLAETGAFAHWAEHPTGNAGIDSGGQGVCANATSPNGACFLSPTQRGELNRQVTARVSSASKNYGLAVVQLKLETLIKKPDELPWYLTLLLGACISAIEAVIPMGLAAFKGAGQVDDALAKLGNDASKIATTTTKDEATISVATTAAKAEVSAAEKEMATLTNAQISSTIKASTALGKSNAVSSFTTAYNGNSKPTNKTDKIDQTQKSGFTAASSAVTEQANEKDAALGYADILNEQADVMWEQLNQDIGKGSDAEVLAIWSAFHPSHHKAAMYHAKLGAELKRYTASEVSKLGRGMAYDGDKRVEREIRIAKVILPGAGVRYAYMDRVFDGWFRDVNTRKPGSVERSGVYDDPQMAFSLDQEADWKIDGKAKRGSEKPLRPDAILSWVEPEFQDLAIQKQQDVWLKPIETFQVSYAHGDMQVIKVGGS